MAASLATIMLAQIARPCSVAVELSGLKLCLDAEWRYVVQKSADGERTRMAGFVGGLSAGAAQH